MARVQPVNPNNPPPECKASFDTIQKKLGKLPNIFTVMGNAPQTLEAFNALTKCTDATSIPQNTRTLISLAVSEENNCQYCLSAHTQMAKNQKLSDSDIMKARKGESSDKKTQAFLRLAQKIVDKQGQLSDSEFQEAKKQGLSEKEILETVLVVTTCIFGNYINSVAATPNDFPAVPTLEMAGAR